MDVKVGDLWAKCLECGGVEFRPLDEPQADGDQKLACKICATRTTRSALLVQVGSGEQIKSGPSGPPRAA